LNPDLSILIDGNWVSVVDIFNHRDLSVVELREHALQREVKEMEAFRKKMEKERKNREKWGW
jgi:hypothetical protein